MTLYEEIYKMKTILRKGWVMRDVKGRIESDAEHTFSLMLLALEIIAKNNLKLDQLKVLKMIAYHELCEIDVGDISVIENYDKQDRYDKEYACIKRLVKEYNMPEIETYWLDFENKSSPEAQFVYKLDKFDAILQSKIYADMQNRPEIYKEFQNYHKGIFDEFSEFKR